MVVGRKQTGNTGQLNAWGLSGSQRNLRPWSFKEFRQDEFIMVSET